MVLLDEIRHQHETPSYSAERQRFDGWLAAEPVPLDTDRDELLQALGVR